MARPRKKGLDYFPLDTDIFEDEKFFDLQNEYGPLGEVIYIRLLCLVYKNGYFYKFESLDKLSAMMIRSVGNRWARDKKTVKDVISYLAKINLFSAELMQRNILTSRSIQERYLAATERRQSKIEEYCLLEKKDFQEGFESVPINPVSVAGTQVNVTETQVNASNNATKESKENEIKLNERRRNEPPLLRFGSKQNILLSDDQYHQLIKDFGQETADLYIEKASLWCDSKKRELANCDNTIRLWLQKDGYKIGNYFDVEKYKFVINNF